MTGDGRATRGRGRPRRADVDARAMAGALQLFSLKGWSGFTIGGTALRANLAKATVYLRWNDRADLLIDALRSADGNWHIANTGPPADVLIEALVSMIRRFSLPQGWTLHCALLDPALPDGVKECAREIADARLKAISDLTASLSPCHGAEPIASPTSDVLATMLVGAAMSFAGKRALSSPSEPRMDSRQYAREVAEFYLSDRNTQNRVSAFSALRR